MAVPTRRSWSSTTRAIACAKVALELMRDYAGGDPLHVDGYTVYDALGDPGRVSNPWDLAYCWVH